jgi:hypothetical protein
VREPEHIRRHRTIARLAVPLLLAWALAGTAQARPEAAGKPDQIVFPVVGKVSYENDFGDPRGQGRHEGNDILAAWRAPVVAVEPGTVRIYTGSSRAGCMLYLYGKSGATYLYIHLNNDVGPDNDNTGPCKPGVAYAPGLANDQKVRAGQLIGYVGNSGDADAAPYHLHFEYHPGGGNAVSPFRLLRRAEKLLFAAPEEALSRAAAQAPTLVLAGRVLAVEASAAAGDGAPSVDGGESGSAPPPPPPPSDGRVAAGAGGLLTIRVTSVRLSSGGAWRVTRAVTLTVPAGTVFERSLAGKTGKLGLADLAAGDRVTVTTAPVALSLDAQRARPGVLAAARILLRG